MILHSAYYLFLWLLLPLMIYIYRKRNVYSSIKFSSVKNLKRLKPSPRFHLRHIPFVLRCFGVVFIVFSLARPQQGIENSKISTEGIDIVLCVDVSSSMLAEDFTMYGKRQNRLFVVKDVVRDFIKKRQNDKIGLVLFSGKAYTQCPLTLDYGVLMGLLEKAEIGMIEDGTAIGSAIAAGVNRLKKSDAKSKVLILLTDGRNNAGKIDPEMAAGIAKTFNIKIYTIGAGTKGTAPYPVKDFFGNTVYRGIEVDIDDVLLKKIAMETGGQYFRATDTSSLKLIYQQINEMETTKSEINIYMDYKELFPYSLSVALIFILAGIVLNNTVFRRIP